MCKDSHMHAQGMHADDRDKSAEVKPRSFRCGRLGPRDVTEGDGDDQCNKHDGGQPAALATASHYPGRHDHVDLKS